MSIPHNNKEIPAEYRTRGAMIQKLQEGNCRVIFKKVNGEERDMMCTLQESVLPKLQSKPDDKKRQPNDCLLYTSPSPRDVEESRMPSSA